MILFDLCCKITFLDYTKAPVYCVFFFAACFILSLMYLLHFSLIIRVYTVIGKPEIQIINHGIF